MIAIAIGPRFIRSQRKLEAEARAKLQAALSAVAQHFGDPHRHAGLGLRKLYKELWECRI